MIARISLALLIAMPASVAIGQTTSLSTEQENSLGWQFYECSIYFSALSQTGASAKQAEVFSRMQSYAIAAAAALIGENTFRDEEPVRRKDVLAKVKAEVDSPTMQMSSSCISLMKSKLELAAPKIRAAAAKKQAEKEMPEKR
jgi:hypothetical protein